VCDRNRSRPTYSSRISSSAGWRAFNAQTTDAEPLGFVGQVVLDAGTTAGIADVLSFIGKGAVRVRGAQRVESRHQEGER
jgi:hypothetical protein